MKNDRFVLTALTPIILLFLVFMLIPIVAGLVISTYDYNPIREENTFVGLDNFAKLLDDDVFLKSLKNTLIFVFVTVALNISLCLFLAQLISSLKSSKLRSAFRVIFFLPCVAPLIASATVWRGLYSTRYGLINVFLEKVFHIEGVDWMGSPTWIMPAVIIFTLWADIGYNIIILSAGMDGIPREFYEAADIDRAGPIKKFFNVTLPLLGRTMSFVIAMTLISHFQMFAQFQVFAFRGGPNQSGNVLTYYIYKTAFVSKDMGYASAIAMVLFLLILVFTVVQQRLNKVDWGY